MSALYSMLLIECWRQLKVAISHAVQSPHRTSEHSLPAFSLLQVPHPLVSCHWMDQSMALETTLHTQENTLIVLKEIRCDMYSD